MDILTHDASAAIKHDGKDGLEVHDFVLGVISCVVILQQDQHIMIGLHVCGISKLAQLTHFEVTLEGLPTPTSVSQREGEVRS